MSSPTHLNTPFYTRLAMILVSIIAIVYICIIGKFVLSPLLFGFLLSMLLLPVASFLEMRLKFSRGLSSTVAIFLLLAIVGLVFFLVGNRITDLAKDWPQFQKQFAELGLDIRRWVSRSLHINYREQMDYINDATDELKTTGTAVLGATVLSLSSIVLFLVFVVIETFFILQYRRHLKKFLLALFNTAHAPVVYDIMEEVQYIVRKYILGLIFQMLIVAALCFGAFYFIGIEYAILLGIIAGLFNIIPYVGILTAFAFTMAITIGSGGTNTQLLLAAGSMIIVHLIDSNFLLPVVVGSKVKINPLITLLGIIVGEMLWGIPGMFLSIPVIAIIKIIFDRIENLKPWGYLLGEVEEELVPETATSNDKEDILHEVEQIKPH